MPSIQILPQNQQETFSQLLGRGLGTGLNQGLQQSLQSFLEQQQQGDLERSLVQAGVPSEIAKVYGRLTEGGKTAAFQKGIELGERNQPQDFFEQEQYITPEDDYIEEEKFEKIPPPSSREIGLTKKEGIQRQESRYKPNIDAIEKTENKLYGLESEGSGIDQLENLNKSGKLPKGIGRLNVKSDGTLRLPFLANPETELFVKTLNEFTTKAKDSFGARVTNFELNRFLQRLPSLMNSEEGRQLIINQMKYINQLDQLKESSLVKAFEKSGGSRKIDLDTAKGYARKIRAKEEQRLRKKINELVKRSDKFDEKKENRPPLESFFK